MVKAFDAVGDPTFRFARPGRSEDEIVSRLSEIVEVPHPDLVAWFGFVDGYEPLREVPLGIAGHALTLDEAITNWQSYKPDIEAGVYAEGRTTFVPFLRSAGINCDLERLPGVVMNLSTYAIDSWVPSLRHICWYWTALREERIFFYVGNDLPLDRRLRSFEAFEALRGEFVIQRMLQEDDDGVLPISIS